MYSNDYTQIKSGLINYVGSLLKASPFEGKASNQYVAATLVEEALKLSEKEDKSTDIFIAKPILRATAIILTKRANELEAIPNKMQVVVDQISTYKSTAMLLNDVADNIKE